MWLNDTSREEGTIVRHAVEVYPLHSDELLLHYECEDGNTIKMVKLTENDTGTFLCVLELANDRNDETTGKIKVLSLYEESEQFSYALDGTGGGGCLRMVMDDGHNACAGSMSCHDFEL